MKILMLTDYFLPRIVGGVERVVYELSKRLVGKGHQVSVVTLNTENSSEFDVIEGFRVYRAPRIDLTPRLGIQLSFSLIAPLLIASAVRREKPDILHAHNLFFWTTTISPLVSLLTHIPLVLTLHLGSVGRLGGIYGGLATLFEKTVGRNTLRRSSHVIAVSEAVREHALLLGVPRSRITVVPNGVDVQGIRPRPFDSMSREKNIRILFVGRLLPNKGPQYLIEAAETVVRKHPQVEFVVVGDGPMLPTLVRQVERVGLGNRFRFLGVVDDVYQVFRSCDIFIRPSLVEGMPLTVLEACLPRGRAE